MGRAEHRQFRSDGLPAHGVTYLRSMLASCRDWVNSGELKTDRRISLMAFAAPEIIAFLKTGVLNGADGLPRFVPFQKRTLRFLRRIVVVFTGLLASTTARLIPKHNSPSPSLIAVSMLPHREEAEQFSKMTGLISEMCSYVWLYS